MRRFMVVAGVVLMAGGANAQPIVGHDGGTVTVRAEEVPLSSLLSVLTPFYSLEMPPLDPATAARRITLTVERVHPSTALVAILQASGLDFAISGPRIVIGDWNETRVALEMDGAPDSSSGVPENRSTARAQRSGTSDTPERRPESSVGRSEVPNIASDGTDDETTIYPMPPVAFIANGENITYLERDFVPYKMRPEVRALRMAIDVTTIP